MHFPSNFPHLLGICMGMVPCCLSQNTSLGPEVKSGQSKTPGSFYYRDQGPSIETLCDVYPEVDDCG